MAAEHVEGQPHQEGPPSTRKAAAPARGIAGRRQHAEYKEGEPEHEESQPSTRKGSWA